MSEIQRYEAVSVWSITKDGSGSYVNYDDHSAIIAQLEADKSNAEYCFRELKKINEQLEQRNSGLEAARIAYASEFQLNSEGEPDVGSIHQNIRKLKADYAQLEAALAEARKDQARYQYVIDWLESNVIATAAFTHARTKSEYDQAIDAAIKE